MPSGPTMTEPPRVTTSVDLASERKRATSEKGQRTHAAVSIVVSLSLPTWQARVVFRKVRPRVELIYRHDESPRLTRNMHHRRLPLLSPVSSRSRPYLHMLLVESMSEQRHVVLPTYGRPNSSNGRVCYSDVPSRALSPHETFTARWSQLASCGKELPSRRDGKSSAVKRPASASCGGAPLFPRWPTDGSVASLDDANDQRYTIITRCLSNRAHFCSLNIAHWHT